MTVRDALLPLADRLDMLALDGQRWAGASGGFDKDGASLGGWINNPFAERLAQLAVDLRDVIEAAP